MRFALVVAGLIAFSPEVRAATDTVRAPENCTRLVSGFATVETGEQTQIIDRPEGCTINSFYIRQSGTVRYKVDKLDIVAPGLLDAYGAGKLPARMEATATGLRMSPDIDDPRYEYLLEIQVRPFDVHFAYDWNSQTGDLAVKDISMSGEALGRLAFSGLLSGVTDLDFEAMHDGPPSSVTAKQVSVLLENRALFETLIAPMLIYTMPEGEDPRPHIAAIRQKFIDFIRVLPESIVPAASKTAIADFAGQFPSPKGKWELDISVADGVPVGSPDITSLLGLLAKPGAINISARHTP